MPEDENQGAKTPSAEDLVKNTKAEFDRKLGNFESQVKQLQDTNNALAQKLDGLKPVAPVAAVKPLRERFYEDEESTLRSIKDEAKAEAKAEMNSVIQTQQTVGEMVAQYPELSDDNNALTKKAKEIHANLPAHLQGTPYAVRIAVREAAADLGIVTKSKRKEEIVVEDDAAVGGAGQGGGSAKSRREKEGEMDDRTLQFAELLGRPVDDEKYIERLKKVGQRKVWTKYRRPSAK